MLPGTPRRPSFTTTAAFGGSAMGAGAGAGATVAAAGVGAGVGGGGAAGGGGWLAPPICACASHPNIAGALMAASDSHVKEATIFRAILFSCFSPGVAPGLVHRRPRERTPAAAIQPP